MMLIKRFMSIVVALTFVFSTLLQYHHHDRMGNIFIHLSFIGEVELGFHSHHDGSCHHQHHHGSEPCDCGDDGDCSMHLDIPLSTVCEDPMSTVVPAVSCLDIIKPVSPDIAATETYLLLKSRHADFAEQLPYQPLLHDDPLRGPPVSVFS